MTIPLVIVHIGDSYYLRDVVEFNAKKNRIIFIGCEKNSYLGEIVNVQHIHYKDLSDDYLTFMKENYYELEQGIDTKKLNEVNADFSCTNNGTYQFLCYARVYFVKRLMELYNLSYVMHIDSDCFILESADELAEALNKKISFGIEHIHNTIHLVGTIHNSFLTIEFCVEFLKLYEDIFANGSKRDLLGKKIECIQNQTHPGYICDMNLYYLLLRENLVDCVDLSMPFKFNEEYCVFDHCISNPTGFNGSQTYKLMNTEYGAKKKLLIKNKKIYIVTVENEIIRLVSIHFNAENKKLIKTFRELLE